MLDPRERESLLRRARRAIERALGVPHPDLSEELAPGPATPMGAFVTLHTKGGELRGCIGTLSSDRPLAEVIEEMAVSAALRDPRFSPLDAGELENVVVEISALSPLQPVSDLEDIEVGRDGLLVSGFGRRGVLLPQVASEHGLDAQAFVEATCHKAGLPKDAWRTGLARLEKFQAEVFSEPGSLRGF